MPAREIRRSSPVAALPGLTAERAAALRRQGLRTVAELAAALRAGRARVPAIAAAYALHPPRPRMPLTLAERFSAALVRGLRAEHPQHRFVPTGSLRRRRPRVGDLDILTTLPASRARVAEAAARAGGEALAQFARGADKSSWIVQLPDAQGRMHRIPLDVFHAPAAEWGSALVHFTGSRAFNIRLRAHARRQGHSLSQHGLRPLAGGPVRRFATERALFSAVGFRWHAPADRQKT